MDGNKNAAVSAEAAEATEAAEAAAVAADAVETADDDVKTAKTAKVAKAVEADTDAGFTDFAGLALFLARSYGQMLRDREYLEKVIDIGVPQYTKEMAIRELSSVSVNYESERVQTSNISRIPERITELLDNGYVEKMNRRLQREMEETVQNHAYLCWKIEVVETAMRERMDEMEQAVFTRIFVRGKSYRQICKAYKKGTMHNKQVLQMKKNGIRAIAEHLKNVACFPLYADYMDDVQKEYLKDNQGGG